MSPKQNNQFADAMGDIFDIFIPPTHDSTKWKNWLNTPYILACQDCKKYHGMIIPKYEKPNPEPPIHPKCRCRIKTLNATTAGQGTQDGKNGADWWLKYFKTLPDYYVTYSELVNAGWKKGKSPNNFLPRKMVTMGEYKNYNGHLPVAEGRTWQEADINYTEGKRNSCRILWSNDGLIFVTYDHYLTFIEIT